VTRRFQITTFRGFFSERELVDFLHILWRHFCQRLLRTWKRILFHTYLDKNGQKSNEKNFPVRLEENTTQIIVKYYSDSAFRVNTADS
jgi:hypothetical protein